jgi:hypothetical protein
MENKFERVKQNLLILDDEVSNKKIIDSWISYGNNLEVLVEALDIASKQFEARQKALNELVQLGQEMGEYD